jgi:hypothetical protein
MWYLHYLYWTGHSGSNPDQAHGDIFLLAVNDLTRVIAGGVTAVKSSKSLSLSRTFINRPVDGSTSARCSEWNPIILHFWRHNSFGRKCQWATPLNGQNTSSCEYAYAFLRSALLCPLIIGTWQPVENRDVWTRTKMYRSVIFMGFCMFVKHACLHRGRNVGRGCMRIEAEENIWA